MRSIAMVICICLALGGCGDQLNKGTLKEALNNYYKNYPAFINLDDLAFGVHFPCNILKGSINTIKRFDLLCKVGLLSRKEVSDTSGMILWGNEKVGLNAVQYSLTDMGKQYFKDNIILNPMISTTGFVFGKNKVVEVSNYSQPAATMGQIFLNVTYSIMVYGIADWAKSNEMQNTFDDIAQAFHSRSDPIKQETTMVKTANGWIDSNQAL